MQFPSSAIKQKHCQKIYSSQKRKVYDSFSLIAQDELTIALLSGHVFRWQLPIVESNRVRHVYDSNEG